jgi:hypothetical protein
MIRQKLHTYQVLQRTPVGIVDLGDIANDFLHGPILLDRLRMPQQSRPHPLDSEIGQYANLYADGLLRRSSVRMYVSVVCRVARSQVT